MALLPVTVRNSNLDKLRADGKNGLFTEVERDLVDGVDGRVLGVGVVGLPLFPGVGPRGEVLLHLCEHVDERGDEHGLGLFDLAQASGNLGSESQHHLGGGSPSPVFEGGLGENLGDDVDEEGGGILPDFGVHRGQVVHALQGLASFALVLLEGVNDGVQHLGDHSLVVHHQVGVVDGCQECSCGLEGGHSDLDVSVGQTLGEDVHERFLVCCHLLWRQVAVRQHLKHVESENPGVSDS